MRVSWIFLGLMVAVNLFGTAASARAEKVVLGKLGQALKETRIYSSPSSRSRIYYKVKAYEYLVIKPSKSATYWSVLLQNGRWGYAPKTLVAELPYDCTMDSGASTRTTGSVSSSQVSRGSSTTRAQAAQYGLQFTGTPYKWGGNDPNRGIDCSGFVKYLYGSIGINLPRTASEQAKVGQKITRLEQLQPGDRLYFWENKRGKIGHTGVYLGNGYFVHSSSGKGGVSTDYLGDPKWLKILVDARR